MLVPAFTAFAGYMSRPRTFLRVLHATLASPSDFGLLSSCTCVLDQVGNAQQGPNRYSRATLHPRAVTRLSIAHPSPFSQDSETLTSFRVLGPTFASALASLVDV